MIYVGLTKGIINATAHWYLAVTEDGTTFKNEDKDTLKEVLKCVEEMQKDTLKEVAICFDHWGASSWIAEIAEFVSKHEHLHLLCTEEHSRSNSGRRRKQLYKPLGRGTAVR